jgi:hypothetical protein
MTYRGRAPGMPYRGLVRINERGVCPVCGKRHAACDNPAQPSELYPPLDTRTIPLRPELRFNAPEERESSMPLIRSVDLTGRPEMATGDYVSPRRLYLNAEGKVVERGDPAAVSLLVGEGGVVPAARARELGLMSEEQQRKAAAKSNEYVVHGPGPDDPGAFYDDGTPSTPAGNEGDSDVRSPRGVRQQSDLDRALQATRQQGRVSESMADHSESGGAQRANVVPSGHRSPVTGHVAPGENPRGGGEVDASRVRSVQEADPRLMQRPQDASQVGQAGQEAEAGQQGTVGEPSGSGEEEQKRRAAEEAAEAKADAPAEDKAADGPRRGRRGGTESK